MYSGSYNSFFLEVIDIVKLILKRIEEINIEIQSINKILKDLPEGKFSCIKNGEYYRWQISSGGKTIYLPKSQEEYAQKLAYRKYLTERLAELQEELKISCTYVNKLSKPLKSDELLKNSDEILIMTEIPRIRKNLYIKVYLVIFCVQNQKS